MSEQSPSGKRPAALSSSKQALLELWRRGHGRPPNPQPARNAAEGPAPLSFPQERLWFVEQLAPGSAIHNISACFQLTGPLNEGALAQAIEEITRRHEALRMGIEVRQGIPVLVVDPEPRLSPRKLSLEHLGAQAEAEARRLAAEEARQPFALGSPPLARITLLRTGSESHLLSLVAHHAIFDGWSLGIFLRELQSLYNAFCGGVPSPLVEPPPRYGEYTRWQRQALTPEEMERLLAYWKQRLAGLPPELELARDRPRPSRESFRGAIHRFRMGPPVMEAVKALARREGVTPFMVLLAAAQLLLQRYTGQEDLAVGTPVANRTRVDHEGIIGVFINTLVLRTSLAGDPSFRELLARVKETTSGALAHQELPLEKLVQALRLSRDAGRNPLFQVLFSFQNAPLPALRLGALSLQPVELNEAAAQFDLTFNLEEAPEGLKGAFTYATDLFDAATIERFACHFQRALEGALANPEHRLSALPVLDETDRQRMLVEWNDTRTPIADARDVAQQFAAQAERTPDAVALVFEDRPLTWRELDQRANQLAWRLRKLGVGPDTLVALCVERSLEMVVGMLGVLKAGGAYLPLEPTYPEERLAFMVEDSRARVLVTRSPHLMLFAGRSLSIVCLDQEEASIALEPVKPLPGECPDSALAYVLYTSGSTGTPKGVMVSRRNLTNFLIAMDERVGREPPGTWLAVTTISFDISGLELLWTLSRGFKVVVAADPRHLELGRPVPTTHAREVDFSLFYFANDEEAASGDKYRLLTEGARFADQHGFAAVWTPERHFHAFGGQYPNPSLMSAYLAAITERVQLRAGSVVLPLHNPIRVAEEWSVVDNLSRGRVGVSVASGWHPNDFVLMPQNYAQRRERMREQIDTLRQLWRGEAVLFRNGADTEVPIRIRPRPVQPELPLWLTAAGNPDTYRQAGELGTHVLTHLLGQSIEQLEEKIALYRGAREQAGHAGPGHVTLMIHTYVHSDGQLARERAKGPFLRYLKSSAELMQGFLGQDARALSPEDLDTLLERAFERYHGTSGLFGTPESCRELVERLRAAGVDEVACLIDFGLESTAVLEGLRHLDALRQLSRRERSDLSLAAQMERHQVTHLQCTPSLARMLLDAPGTAPGLAGLTSLLLGGEALPSALVAELREVTSARILNMYGPTETTIWSATHPVVEAKDPIPLGRPIANTQLYVLDARMNPVPAGVASELYIGGEGVTRGYLQRPELTATRFVPDPFGTTPGARLYRTGDRARFLADGTLEFLGRLDHQVKLRGHRIELGELEATLAQHPRVKEAVTLVREDAPGDRRLVAYLVPGAESPAPEEIRAFVKERLPEYMVPSTFVMLQALPLTPNGKVDRRALPAPEVENGGATLASLKTPVEQLLSGLWTQVLGTRVGLNDSFFEHGGHSLLATQLIARIRDTFSVELPLRSLFETPTLAGMAGQVEAAMRAGNLASMPRPTRLPPGTPLEPSFGQERLWFLDQLEPDSPLYNDHVATLLTGTPDLPALEKSLHLVTERHQVLRTTFERAEGRPLLSVHPLQPQPLEVVDLQALPAEERRTALERHLADEVRRPFNLSRLPLLRWKIYRLAPDEHVLLLTMPHIVWDGWSAQVMLRELAALYAPLVRGEPSPLGELPLQYSDYAHWQRRLMVGEALEQRVNFWRKQLAGAPPLLELPTDRPRPPVQTFAGAAVPVRLSRALVEALESLGQREGTTLFMTLLAAFQVLLSRYSGQEDVLVGSPVANRNRPEWEGLLGFFVNTLVLRGDLRGNPTFRELLARTRQTALATYAYQDLPFEKLVEELNPVRDVSHSPLFQVMLVLQTEPPSTLGLPGISLERMEAPISSARFDLTLVLEPRDGELVGTLGYSTDLFDASTISRWVEHFQTLLAGVVAHPEQRLADLPLLTEAERHLQLVEWIPPGDFSSERCLHELFEAHARRAPDALALTFQGEQLTYGALDARANAVTHALDSLGVEPGRVVAVLLEVGLDLVAALLGILKAGCSFVTLDMAQGAARQRQILEDVGPACLLTSHALRTLLGETLAAAAPPLLEWEQVAKLAQGRTTSPSSRARPADSAYVVYTSGSTGKPKGIEQSHEAFRQFLEWQARAFNLKPGKRFAVWSPITYDAAYCELFGALCFGATACLAPREVRASPRAVLEWLEAERMTDFQTVPSFCAHLLELLEAEPAKELPQLEHVLLSGEAIPVELGRAWLRRFGTRPRLVNLYGPTECVLATHYPIERISPDQRRIPAGRAIDGRQILILDRNQQLCPLGVKGEIYVRSRYLTRGYYHRPEETSRVFLANPLTGEAADPVYRTGDFGRWLPGGILELLGRVDNLVKIRGNRVELGEVEAALAAHPAVRECVVVTHAYKELDLRLVGYVVKGGEVDASGLRTFLERQLPAFMVPSTFVFMESLPRTSTNKPDRNALPRPEPTAAPGVAPETELERLLCSIWQEVLGQEQVGTHDRFFDLGGHSLLMTQVHGRLEQRLGRKIPLVDLFRFPTISALAHHLGSSETPATASEPTPKREWVEGRHSALKRLKQLRVPGTKPATRQSEED